VEVWRQTSAGSIKKSGHALLVYKVIGSLEDKKQLSLGSFIHQIHEAPDGSGFGLRDTPSDHVVRKPVKCSDLISIGIPD
jgi:hypothetical protein